MWRVFSYPALILLFLVLSLGAYVRNTKPNPAHPSEILQTPSDDSVKTQSDTSKFTPRPQQSGKLSRRAKALLRRQGGRESMGEGREALRDRDTTRIMPVDSAARLAHFHHLREDLPMVDVRRPAQYSLYLPDPLSVRHSETLDSAQWKYRVQTSVSGFSTKVPLDVPFEEYAALRMERAIRQNWEAMTQAYKIQEEKKAGLGEVFGQITKVEIPIPKNPLFSIFGPNIIKLQINGAVDIHSAFRNTEIDQFINSPLGNVRNEPDFQQQVQVNVKGEIGDKLKIDADWNTQRTFEYENQLKVRYTGYEDEIVKSVEAGNVSLPSNSSFISSSQALFGIKAGLQFGPLALTTVASQKKGQIKDITVAGGARPTPFERRATDYSRDHYFIDTLYIPLYDSAFVNIPAIVNPARQIREMEVWVSRVGAQDPSRERRVVAFMDENLVLQHQNSVTLRTSGVFQTQKDSIDAGDYIRLEPDVDYKFHEYAGFITFNRSLQAEQAVAVAYSIPEGKIGNFGTRDTLNPLIMKLVRPRLLGPHHRTAWRMMLKNRYPLGGRGIKKDGFDLNIYYQVSGSPDIDNVLPQAVRLNEMFGLDRFHPDGSTPGADGTFDYFPQLTIDEQRGELIFPTVEPFDTSSIYFFLTRRGGFTPGQAKTAADSFSFGAIYDTTDNGARNSDRNKFVIRGTITPSTASSYNLGFNIVEGSVDVIVDGQSQPKSDYTVDYITGQVVIRNQALLAPGRNLQIRYEANDLFQLASKTLLGARGDFNLGKNASLGFTIMNLNQQSLSDKVRLGEEPISNTIMGVDGGTNFEAPFITRALNFLPGIETIAASNISIRGEAAYMSPDPNTRKSTIPQDEDKGIAYIDDFEGARRLIPFGVNSLTWKDASPPFYISGIDAFTPTGRNIPTTATVIRDSTRMFSKAKAFWFNVQPSDVSTNEIWPERSVAPEQSLTTVLDFYMRPGARGVYNYSPNLDSTLFANPQQNWAGMQQLLSTTSTNVHDENINFIELWINVERASTSAKLNINMGLISEDVIPVSRLGYGKLDTEDGLLSGIRNTTLNKGEDVGIDGLTDLEERNRYGEFINQLNGKYTSILNPDPSGDNFIEPPVGTGRAPLGEYEYGNGTEGNERTNNPDTEDLNRNNNLDRVNAYFEYEIPLDTTNADFLKYRTGGGHNGWHQIRIPINEYTRSIGDATFSTVEAVRMWVAGAQSDVHLLLTEMNLVGNQWEELIKKDSVFRVSVVNIEDNPSYVSPPGVERARDRSRPTQNIVGNEQALNIIINNLEDGQNVQAIKRFTFKPLDLFNYRALKMFVRGDPSFRFTQVTADSIDYDAEVFLRFGTDTLNYYEYRAPLRPDRFPIDNGWDRLNDVTVNFAELTGIKLLRDSAGALTRRFPTSSGPSGSTFQIRGEPTLTNVRFISIGVENPGGRGTTFPLKGEVWLNELRLIDVDDTPGWAYRFDTSVKLADVGNVVFSFLNRDPNFHGLEEHFGSRLTGRSWNISASFSLEKFLPQSWTGSALGLTYSHVEGIQVPRYLPGTDVLVSEAAQRTAEAVRLQGKSDEEARASSEALRTRTQTLNITETYALPSIRLVLPVDSWLVRETINRMAFGYTYTVSRRRDPVTESFVRWDWNARASYGLQFSAENYLQPFDLLGDFFLINPWRNLKLYYTPRTLNGATTVSRGQKKEKTRTQGAFRPTVRSMAASRSMTFNWQFVEGGFLNPGIDYQVNINSSLVHLELDQFGRQRSFWEILDDMFLSDRLVNFGIDQTYSQVINLNTRLVVPPVLELDKIITPSLRYSSQYDWSNNLQAGALGKSAGWSSNLSMSLDFNIKKISSELWSATPTFVSQKDTGMSKSFGEVVDQLTRVLFKAPLFDFEKVSFTFTQQNRSQNGGVLGGTGFANIFSRIPFVQSSLPEYGPSLLYQLGLSSDPHGDVILKTKSSFPFITGYTVPGLRAARSGSALLLTDVFSQSNRMTIRTSRPLWEGASLELNWNVGWSYNQNRTVAPDSLGTPVEQSRVVSGDVDRSFLSFPPILFFEFFKTSIEDVNKKFEQSKLVPDGRPNDVKLSEAFEDGLEALPIFKKLLGGILPRVNWSLRWDGLERLPLLQTLANRVTLDHSYSSNYRRRWRITPEGTQITESQQVTQGFSPLAGLNITFKDFVKGNFTATIRYSAITSFDLVPSIFNITESGTNDISMTANFNRQGFELPVFGLSLSNDIDLSFSYTYAKTSRKLYDMKAVLFKKEGTPLEGSSRTVLEPRIRYVLSARVTASFYYRYTKIKPDADGSKIPGSTVNEGGLDVRVAIQ
ncbi:MAG: cell surface protein SprA [Ignavibacteriales bacterium]|nr:cell surface protein SprA [Ignavibacteriales bacterium]